ncbi:MAG: hypothetical protein A2W64_03930 [Candidatus Zambryskibacteria bacterium RIFCSPLOWO2_02_39_10]|nr:MAG: hypothetical protein A2W64_03930 [Candidatus Zambryskibacteria bacterium RIFCSPLOWO2_02_39_10]
MKKSLDKVSVQDILLKDIAQLKTDLDNAKMKLPPGLAGMYGEILVWKELEKRFMKKGFRVEFGSGQSRADIVLYKDNKKINVEVKTSRLKEEGFGKGYGFAINLKKCKNHTGKYNHPSRGKIFGDFCYFDFIVAISLSNNLIPSFYIFPNKFIKDNEKLLRNQSRQFKSHTHRIIFIEKEKKKKSREITSFDRKMKKLKDKYKNAWHLIKVSP